MTAIFMNNSFNSKDLNKLEMKIEETVLDQYNSFHQIGSLNNFCFYYPNSVGNNNQLV